MSLHFAVLSFLSLRSTHRFSLHIAFLASGQVIEVDENDPNYIVVTIISQADLCGRMPSWVLNQQAPRALQSFKEYAKFVEAKYGQNSQSQSQKW